MEKREELLTNKPPLSAKPETNGGGSSSANTSSSSQSTFDPRTFDAAAAAGASPQAAAVDPALPRGPPAVDQVRDCQSYQLLSLVENPFTSWITYSYRVTILVMKIFHC